MTRLKKLDLLKTDAWYKNLIGRLTRAEHEYMVKFITDNDGLSKEAFGEATRRFCMREDRPKRWSIIEEIVAVCNDSL